jgi:hypothetical protein
MNIAQIEKAGLNPKNLCEHLKTLSSQGMVRSFMPVFPPIAFASRMAHLTIYISLIEDITQQQLAEEALRASSSASRE